MLPSQLAKQVIEVLAPGERFDYGKKRADWANPIVARRILGCSVQPGESSEIVEGREATIWDYKVFAPLNCGVKADDRVRWRGEEFRVVAQPVKWVDPTSRGLSHVTFQLTASKG